MRLCLILLLFLSNLSYAGNCDNIDSTDLTYLLNTFDKYSDFYYYQNTHKCEDIKRVVDGIKILLPYNDSDPFPEFSVDKSDCTLTLEKSSFPKKISIAIGKDASDEVKFPKSASIMYNSEELERATNMIVGGGRNLCNRKKNAQRHLNDINRLLEDEFKIVSKCG